MTILGKKNGDALGYSVSSAGDVNGDGIDDIIVGAWGYDISGMSGEGIAYVFFGSTTLSGTNDLGGVASADVTFIGRACNLGGGVTGVCFGGSVSAAGDINGDGFDDMVVGAFKNDDGTGNDAGAAYIFYGASDLSGTKNLTTTASADVTILGSAAGDWLGRYVSGAGDINGDGFDDIIVGATYGNGATNGAAYIFFGAANLSGTKDLDGVASADVTILGKASQDYLGEGGISGAGDVNGDGFDDVIVEAGYNDDGTGAQSGAVYIFFGSTTLSGTLDLAGAASADVTILGKGASDFLGHGISGVGDVNDDGFDDVIVGARGNADGGATNEGAAYIFFGASDLSGTKDLGRGASADMTILGEDTTSSLGESVSGVGDVNGDGIPDIIVGAHNNDDGTGTNPGAAYIFFGATDLSGTKDTGASDEDVAILGKVSGDTFGRSVGGGRSNPGH